MEMLFFGNAASRFNQYLRNVASGHRENGVKDHFIMLLGYIVKLQGTG